ncbi:hypothetical protein D7B24_003758 [Verticillium nonalfalfae]|uniref:Uncharacterized protein n=1 Tax=Verticillium nonalfalfae TaxID=1051616 RepID=A0A3M9YH56_9PEZI|nr:uncharacterized protein D7B24_003758 [Verticillium nonalfalfae]RNJ58938.1 hypothetical protein D7B24_003758 [Verticillium nonalfalfae]
MPRTSFQPADQESASQKWQPTSEAPIFVIRVFLSTTTIKECYTTATPAVIQATMNPVDSPGEELHTARHCITNFNRN